MNMRAKHNANPLNTRGGPKELPTVRAVVIALAGKALTPRQAIRKLDAIVVDAFNKGMRANELLQPQTDLQLNIEEQPHAERNT